MNLESFTALDEQITKDDWKRTPDGVRQLLQWLFENYEERLADLEEEKALSKIENEVSAERSANDSIEPKETSCSFCGKKREEVIKLIAGPNVHICNECVEICTAILDDDIQ